MKPESKPSTPRNSAEGIEETADSRAAGAAGRADSSVFVLGTSMVAGESDASAPTVRSGGGGRGERGGAGGERPGAVIGRYKLVQQIGEGGFGAVYLAEQEVPVRRQVALKIIKLGMDTEQVITRFEAERQALALMEHPNIAKVLDAGATDTGRPYFVMELVRGVPITDYCDQQQMPFADRLKLFMQVCGAVQHAHQKGIIHRDIKPSNVLVTQVDDQPAPKVIDFGIAKATQQRLTEQTMFTEFGQFMGTPAYMSPEQADSFGEDIDTRSDIYSLGVLLYELLTGSTPFDIKTLRRAGLGEIQRIIQEVEPPRPSTRLSGRGAELETVARQRSIEPRKLSTALRGDLDWIITKAIEKDRTRRYDSANSLALDIERHLTGEPVIAAPPSTAYRIRKFVRRNRWGVAAACAVGLALLLGLAGTTYSMRQALLARDAEEAAKQMAQREAARAVAAEQETAKRAEELTQVSQFQANMLGQVDATNAGIELMNDIRAKFRAALEKSGVPETERAARADAFGSELQRVNATDAAAGMIDRTILKPAIQAIDTQMKDQPAVDASLRATLSGLYQGLGLTSEALPLQERALAIRESVLGKQHRDTLKSMSDMGILLESAGKPAEAERFMTAALEERRRALGENDPDTLIAMGIMGDFYRSMGKFAEAEPLLRVSLERLREVRGAADRDTLIGINKLGFLMVDQGKLADAEPLWREAYEKGKEALGEGDRDVLVWINNLGGLLQAQGKYQEAEPFFRESLEKHRLLRGEDHPSTIWAIGAMAGHLSKRGMFEEAETYYRQALEKAVRVFGPQHPDTLTRMSAIGGFFLQQNRFAEAEPYLRSTLEQRRSLLGPEHPDTIDTLSMMAKLLRGLGKTAESEAINREGLSLLRRTRGDEHPDTLIQINNLGNFLLMDGRLDEAEPFIREAAEKRRRVSGEDHPETLTSLANLAYLLDKKGAVEEAEKLHRELPDRFRRVLGADHPTTLNMIRLQASFLRAHGKAAEAEPHCRELLAGYERRLGKDHARTASARVMLGETLVELERFSDAEPELLGAERILSGSSGVAERHQECVEALITLYEVWDKAEPGKGYDAKAAEWKQKRDEMGASSPSKQPSRQPDKS